MSVNQTVSCHISADYAGRRLDKVLSELLPDYSRARIQQWIKTGAILIDGCVMRPRDRVLGGEHVQGYCPPTLETSLQAQAIDLTICFEDESILVINKPAGLVVHPAAGNPDNTLVNGLLHYAPELEMLPRAGLVHRLDKDTSGLLVVARNLKAHHSLVGQLQQRTMGRHYQAVVNGVMAAGGTLDAPVGRHPVDRKRMAVIASGKPAVTHYRVMERFRSHTHVALRLETGRTHQIRVHLRHLHFPIVGDPVYGGRMHLPVMQTSAAAALTKALQEFQRQALHAATLVLTHPESGEVLEWHAEPPADMVQLLTLVREDQTEYTNDDRTALS
jgi:23S rRNA pseudouridine1911/1915/1917 synthase